MSIESPKIEKLDKRTINLILEKVERVKKKKDRIVLISFSELYKALNKKEKGLIKEILDIKPRKYEFKGPFIGIENPSKNPVSIKGQKYIFKKRIVKIPVQYLPERVYSAYLKLNQEIKKDLGVNLLIESGYRSPAYQLCVFIYYLKFHKWNFKKVVKRAAIPGYSEHGDSLKTAIDFITEKGIPNDERPFDFVKTREYKWLLKNAEKFNFYQSYPKGNKLGVAFEPWHWRFKK